MSVALFITGVALLTSEDIGVQMLGIFSLAASAFITLKD